MGTISELKRIIESKDELIEAQATTIRQLEEYMLKHLMLVKVGRDIQKSEMDRDMKVRQATLQQSRDRLNEPITQEEIDKVIDACKPAPIVWPSLMPACAWTDTMDDELARMTLESEQERFQMSRKR